MFQGKPPLPGDARPLSVVQEEGDFLRKLTWADLVALLKASRARRAAGEQAGDGMEASFDATCARRIAAHHGGKQAVNLEGSSSGKEVRRRPDEGCKGAGADCAPDTARK
ncbi:MAG: hypothetical protein J0I69_04550 [Altererythrobacter sp.]|nr:hypothetical protein [Altererythrobacter sp.]